MRNRIRRFKDIWKGDYHYSTIISSTVSALINLAFTIFNGILGIVYHSLWHGSICIYYLLLTVIRAIIISAQKKEMRNQQGNGMEHRRKIYIGTHILLILMDVSLIVPIAIIAKGERSYTYGLIPAIAMAAYTTYRITTGIIHFLKSRRNDNVLVSELRMINFSDALLSLLTLQNALIIANGGMNDDMKTLTIWTSTGIFTAIIFITIWSFLKAKRVR